MERNQKSIGPKGPIQLELFLMASKCLASFSHLLSFCGTWMELDIKMPHLAATLLPKSTSLLPGHSIYYRALLFLWEGGKHICCSVLSLDTCSRKLLSFSSFSIRSPRHVKQPQMFLIVMFLLCMSEYIRTRSLFYCSVMVKMVLYCTCLLPPLPPQINGMNICFRACLQSLPRLL